MDSTTVYLTIEDGAVGSVPIAEGNAVVVSPPGTTTANIAVDGTGLHWSTADGTIVRLAHGATTPSIVAIRQATPLAVALDDWCVY